MFTIEDMQGAVDYLKQFPEEIPVAWDHWNLRPGGQLFTPCAPPGRARRYGGGCGCLTQVRFGSTQAFTPELTVAVRKEIHLPKCVADIEVGDLPVFAIWQLWMQEYWYTGNLKEAMTRPAYRAVLESPSLAAVG